MLESVDDLELVLDIVLGIDDFNDLWNLNDFFLDDLDFLYIDVLGVDLDDLLNFNWDFLDDLFSGSNFNDLFDVLLDDFVNLDQLWNDGFKFDDLVLVNKLLNELFDFNNSWDFDDG